MLKMNALSDNELRGVTGGTKGNKYRRHLMKDGESLEDVAAQFGVAEAELIRINQFTNFQLKRLGKGSVIMIPMDL